MKTLTSPVSTEAAAEQSGWTELYDFYLKSSITGPFGSTATLRLTILPGGLGFFTPQIAPEPSGTQGDAATYTYWNLQRETAKAASKFTNDRISISASNVTGEWAQMLAAVEWRDTPVVIRKVPTTIAAPTADDCVVIFAGQIDSARVSLEQIQFSCSNDMANLTTISPRENMHTNCRFNWADDLCTAIRFLAENHKAKTVGSSSTTTRVKSAGFTEDTGALGSGAEVVGLAVTCDAATDKVAATAHGLENGQLIQFVGSAPTPCSLIAYYYVVNKATNDFQVSLTAGGGAINLTSSPTTAINSFKSYGTDLVNPLADGSITTSSENAGLVAVAVTRINNIFSTLADHNLAENDAVTLATTGALPSPLVAGTVYYAHPRSDLSFRLSATPGGALLALGGGESGTHTVSTVGTFQGYNVKSQKDYWWKFATAADWGTKTQGYWQIDDAQAGLANGALKPYLQIDFGSAKTPRVWRFSSVPGLKLEELPRLLVIFSSSDAATWAHEQYFELPPRGGVLFDCLMPKASTKRYWRICVRTRWAEALFFSLTNKVFAYEEGRHWWASGQLTFKEDTTTVALRGVTRRVLESYSGEAVVPVLAVAPANGDTFTVQRGCPNTWNACNERRNWENFGGFLDLPTQTVIR